MADGCSLAMPATEQGLVGSDIQPSSGREKSKLEAVSAQ